MADQNIQPIFVLPEGALRNTGKGAQKANIAAAKAVADTVRTTLGPKGMDKMLVDSMGEVVITNDGVTILEEMNIDHPAAKMIVEIAKVQEEEVGDGTTTAVILGGELLKNAEDLLDKNIHPTVIARGYEIAANKSKEILNNISEPADITKDALLKQVAITAMTGKNVALETKQKLADMAFRAVSSILEVQNGEKILDLDNIKLEKKEGAGSEASELISGLVLDKERVHSGMPRLVKNANILLLESPLEVKETEIDAKIQITDPSQMQAFIEQEEKMLQGMVEKVAASGAKVIFCQKGVDDAAQHYLAKRGIFAVRRVKKSDMVKLAKATGGIIVSNLREITKEDLGFAGVVEEKKLGGENMTFVEKCKNPKAVTIIVRGGTAHVVSEVERALNDAIGDLAATVNVGKCVAGGGAVEMEIAKRLREFSESLGGREQLAIQAFADTLEVIPRTLAENAGLDPIDVLTEIKSKHDNKQKWFGLNVNNSKVEDTWKRGVIEPEKIKTQAIDSASDAAIMLLRIDDVISAAKSPAGPGPTPPPGMEGGMPGGMM